jgi:hypothetical protein
MKLRGTISAIAMGILVLGIPKISHAGDSHCKKTHSYYRYNGGVVKHWDEEEPADCRSKDTKPDKLVTNEEKAKPAQTSQPATKGTKCTKTHSVIRCNSGIVTHLGEDGPADCIRRNTQPAKKAANNGKKAAPQDTAQVGYSTYSWANARAKTNVADQSATTTLSASSSRP